MRKSILDEVATLLKLIENVTYSIKMKEHDTQQVVCMCMHGTIIENAEATVALLRNTYDYPALLLVRSMLESFAKLLYIKKDKERINELIYDYYKKRVAQFNEIEHYKDKYPSLRNIFDAENFKEEQKNVRGQCDKFKKAKTKTINIVDIFVSTNLLAHYTAIYRSLSNFSHHNIEALEDRHIRVDESGNKIFYLFNQLPTEVLLIYIGYLIKLPYWSVKEVAFFDLDSVSSEVDEIGSKVEEFIVKFHIDEE